MLIALLIATAVALGLAVHVRQLNRRLKKYEFVDGPRILDIPIEFRPCPDCGSPLWGGITPERLPLTPSTFRFVTAIDPRRVAADGTPVVEELRDVQPSEVDELYERFGEIGWCTKCHKLQPAGPTSGAA